MAKPKFLDELLAQEMSRKEFLVRIGATGLALVGVTGLLKTLSGLSTPATGRSYGATPYGGKENPDSSLSTSQSES